MGSPVAPNRQQYAELELASQLTKLEELQQVPTQAQEVELRFILPRQGVSLLILE